MKHRVCLTTWAGILFIVFFLPVAYTAQPSQSFSQVVIVNESNTYKHNALAEVPIPPEWEGSSCTIMNEADKASSIPYLRKTTETKDCLLVQVSLAPFEEKKLILRKGESDLKGKRYIAPSHSPGTDFLFVNYKQAILISTEQDNEIQFFSNEGKQFLPETEPVILGEGKSYILQTISPQLIHIKSAKPIFVYASSMNYQNDNVLIEAGDSDTTTLYTNYAYIYLFKHIWISSYEETTVNLMDQNGRNVFSKTLSANSGYFKDDLKPGAYKVTSDHPVTIQFGYLDDENFSFIHGQNQMINGFAFGELVVQSIFPDTTVQIKWENQEKAKHQFKEASEIEKFNSIEAFNPKTAEYRFFSLSSNHPVRICSFSSGNNFGGEFITGTSGTYKDDNFQLFTTRVSKEFSKEQRNLIELIGLHKDTNVEIKGSFQKRITLQENTHFDLPSSTPLEPITISSNAEMMVCQLHNYTNKGLFYFVPALSDATISIASTNTIGEGIFQETPHEKKQWVNWFRIKESLKNSVHIPYLPLPLFFIGIIGILITVLLISLSKLNTSNLSDYEPSEPSLIENDPEVKEKIIPVIEKKEKPSFILQIPDLEEPSNTFIYPTLPKTEEIANFIPIPDISEESIEKQDDTLAFTTLPTNPIKENFIVKTSVVLDPGSANRLFFEKDLPVFENAYIASASLKKLPNEIHEYLKKVDLNLQDQARISNLLRSLPIREEAAKAIAICKKMKIAFYISSYSLPQKILDVVVLPVSEWKQSSLH